MSRGVLVLYHSYERISQNRTSHPGEEIWCDETKVEKTGLTEGEKGNHHPAKTLCYEVYNVRRKDKKSTTIAEKLGRVE
jgi:hypothetical protein